MAANASPLPIISYSIDGQPPINATIAPAVPLTMPSLFSGASTAPIHTLRVVFRSNAGLGISNWSGTRTGSLLLTSMQFGVGSTIGAAPAASRTAIALGDSIVQGYKTVGYGYGGYSGATLVQNSDASLNAPSLLATLTGVEMGTVGFGGQWVGTCTSGSNCNSGSSGDQLSDASVPPMYQSFNQLWSGQARSWPSNLAYVLLNGGTNDQGKGGTCATITAGVTNTVTGILGQIPSTALVFVQDPYQTSRISTSFRGCVQAGVSAVNNPRVIYIDTTGWENTAFDADGVHPLGALNAQYAARLAAVINPALAAVGSAQPFRQTFH